MEALFHLPSGSPLETNRYQHLKVQFREVISNLNKIQLNAWTFQLNVPLAGRLGVTP